MGDRSPAVMVFDVGGTDVKVALADVVGPHDAQHRQTPPHIRAVRRISTTLDPDNPGESIVQMAAAEVAAQRAAEPETSVVAAGLVVPGLVDEESGVGKFSANLGWRDFPFRDRLRTELGVPVYFGHDVGTASAAEHTFGAARDADNALIMVLGTGIAASYFTDGRLLRGGGLAGEVGFSQVPHPDGGLTILEELGSARGIATRYCDLSGHTAPEGFGAREVLAAARDGDEVAQLVFAQGVAALAFVISQSVAMLGTSLVVLGGGLAEAGDELFGPLAGQIDRLLSFQDRPTLVPATLGEDAGVIGCAVKTLRVLGSERVA